MGSVVSLLGDWDRTGEIPEHLRHLDWVRSADGTWKIQLDLKYDNGPPDPPPVPFICDLCGEAADRMAWERHGVLDLCRFCDHHHMSRSGRGTYGYKRFYSYVTLDDAAIIDDLLIITRALELELNLVTSAERNGWSHEQARADLYNAWHRVDGHPDKRWSPTPVGDPRPEGRPHSPA